jgi:2-polyprenyl-3-methyl-5-hydroxy-6-metoxy-1,4-benzoquinol methylase
MASHQHEDARKHEHENDEHSGHDNSKWKMDFSAWDDRDDLIAGVRLYIDFLHAQPFWRQHSSQDLQVCDVGCGTGRLLRTLVSENKGKIASAIGADVEPGMLKVFAEKLSALQHDVGDVVLREPALLKAVDGSDLVAKLGGSSFDVALCSMVVGHVRPVHVGSFFDALAALVRAGAHLFLSEWMSTDDDVAKEAANDAETNVSDGGHHHTAYSPSSVRALLVARGFCADSIVVEERQLPMHGETYPIMLIVARKEP